MTYEFWFREEDLREESCLSPFFLRSPLIFFQQKMSRNINVVNAEKKHDANSIKKELMRCVAFGDGRGFFALWDGELDDDSAFLAEVAVAALWGGQLMFLEKFVDPDSLVPLPDLGTLVDAETGNSALHIACLVGNPPLVKLILRHTACDEVSLLRAVNMKGKTPLELARNLESPAILEEFLASGGAALSDAEIAGCSMASERHRRLLERCQRSRIHERLPSGERLRWFTEHLVGKTEAEARLILRSEECPEVNVNVYIHHSNPAKVTTWELDSKRLNITIPSTDANDVISQVLSFE